MANFKAALAATTAFLFLPTTAHMIMNTPYPFNLHSAAAGQVLVQVDPLYTDGEYPFPCQGISGIQQTTTLTAGETTLVNFTGGAQHGGGSCQFAVSYDGADAPAKSWKVIYTIIGGCPASAPGNLEAAAPDVDGRADSPHCTTATDLSTSASTTDCVRMFNVPIPAGLKSGNATFAWVWYNKLGNREMYMNCAAVDITGGSSDDAFTNALPELFVANAGPGTCTTGDGLLNIPNPGQYGMLLENPAPGSGGDCAGATDHLPTFGVAQSPAAPAASSAAVNTAASAGTATAEDSGDSSPSPSPSPSTLAATASSLPPPPSPSSSSSSPDGTVACSGQGTLVCIGTSKFGLCDNGRAVPQDVAFGTVCSNGVIERGPIAFKVEGAIIVNAKGSNKRAEV